MSLRTFVSISFSLKRPAAVREVTISRNASRDADAADEPSDAGGDMVHARGEGRGGG